MKSFTFLSSSICTFWQHIQTLLIYCETYIAFHSDSEYDIQIAQFLQLQKANSPKSQYSVKLSVLVALLLPLLQPLLLLPLLLRTTNY